ncbi:MAG: hypothetical protein ACRDBQ_06810 [Shewanella sp.]
MTFEEFVTKKISGPHRDWYDPNGNSSCAVVCRMRSGYLSSLRWEFSQVVCDVKYFLTNEFKGIDTPLIWFIQLLILPVLFPVVPFTRVKSRYREAINDYRIDYEKASAANGWDDE